MKSPGTGKTRLDGHFSHGDRTALAAAMFSDVLIALSRATAFSGVLVVSADTDVARTSAMHDATWIDDQQASSHSDAAMIGIRHALDLGAERVLLLPGDCPAVTPEELDALAIKEVPERSVGILSDRHGTGTNGLLLTPPDAIVPAFGPGSCERHLQLAAAAGAAAILLESPGFQMDVDTPDDLASLADHLSSVRGTAANTRGFLAQRMNVTNA